MLEGQERVFCGYKEDDAVTFFARSVLADTLIRAEMQAHAALSRWIAKSTFPG